MVLKGTKLNRMHIYAVSLLAITGFTGLMPSTIHQVFILGLCALLFFDDNIYLAYPVMIFYYLAFGQFLGMSVYRYFSILFIISALRNNYNKKLNIKWYTGIMMCVMILYALITYSSYNLRAGIFLVLDVICIVMLINQYLTDYEKLKNFFYMYCIVAILAFITGLVNGSFNVSNMSQMSGVAGVEIIRYNATFEDPNYMGFFCTIAIFSAVALKLFKPAVRIAVVVILYVIMLSSISITAILVNVVIWIVYLVITKKINAKAFIIMAAVSIAFVILYKYGLDNTDTPILGSLSARIEDKLEDLFSQEYGTLTSGRAGVAGKHIEYFIDQPIWKQIFGFNIVTSSYTVFNSLAHNEFIDMSLNVGVLGAFTLISCFLYRCFSAFLLYIKTKSPQYLCVAIIKTIWLCYAMTLTIFGDFRFMIMFFI